MAQRPKSNIFKHNYVKKTYGVERRRNMAKEILENGTPFPKPLQYKDIDASFKDFVNTELPVSYDGSFLPTIVLLSSQRFSEYAQTWQYTDNNRNLLMNFKTIARENNPKPGQHQGGLWNIPGDYKCKIAEVPVLDNNGTESMLIYTMKQPYAVDIMYELSIFTNKYELLNTFNEQVNDKFKSRQCYIRPNDHYVPMVLEDISDESEYNIEDRKFFSQTYQIRAMAYIINEEDFEAIQVPIRKMVVYEGAKPLKKENIEVEDDWYNKETMIRVVLPPFEDKSTFVFDEDITVYGADLINVRDYRINVNGVPVYVGGQFNINSGDKVELKATKLKIEEEGVVVLKSYNENIRLTDEEAIP